MSVNDSDGRADLHIKSNSGDILDLDGFHCEGVVIGIDTVDEDGKFCDIALTDAQVVELHNELGRHIAAVETMTGRTSHERDPV